MSWSRSVPDASAIDAGAILAARHQEGGILASESPLRSASASFLARLSRLEDLERTKRDLEPGSPEQLRVSREVEALAREVLEAAGVQSDLVEQAAATQLSGTRPARADSAREIHVILGEWREAERILAGETPGSTGWETARADVERLRDEYRRAFEAGLQNR